MFCPNCESTMLLNTKRYPGNIIWVCRECQKVVAPHKKLPINEIFKREPLKEKDIKHTLFLSWHKND